MWHIFFTTLQSELAQKLIKRPVPEEECLGSVQPRPFSSIITAAVSCVKMYCLYFRLL